jgi:hypothetical protein
MRRTAPYLWRPPLGLYNRAQFLLAGNRAKGDPLTSLQKLLVELLTRWVTDQEHVWFEQHPPLTVEHDRMMSGGQNTQHG